MVSSSTPDKPGSEEVPDRRWIRVVRLFFALALFIACVVYLVSGRAVNPGFRWVLVFALAWAISTILTPFAARLSYRFGWLDMPAERKIHSHPTPLLGGLVMIFAFNSALLFNSQYSLAMKGVSIGGAIVWLLGVLDDRRELPAVLKLFGQFLAVAVLLVMGVRVTFLPDTWWGITSEVLLTLVWVIGITNAVNFLDGMDGLATGMCAIISFFLALVALQTGQSYFAYVAIALLASCLAFLPYNFRRKRSAAIFLGDNGSTFLGFTLAATVLMGDWSEDNLASLIVPLLLLGVPIFDMVLTTVMRFRNHQVRTVREWLIYTGRDHFHHRLAALGIGRYRAVVVIWTITVILGISAVVLKQARGIDAVLLLLQEALIFAMISFFMIYVRSNQIRLFAAAQRGVPGGNDTLAEEITAAELKRENESHPGSSSERPAR